VQATAAAAEYSPAEHATQSVVATESVSAVPPAQSTHRPVPAASFEVPAAQPTHVSVAVRIVPRNPASQRQSVAAVELAAAVFESPGQDVQLTEAAASV